MKIQIHTDDQKISFYLPTSLVLNGTLIKFGLRIGSRYAPTELSNISSDAVAALCRELVRVKRKYGSWELVEVLSATEEKVKVVL